MSRALMGSEKLPQLRTVILSTFLHNSLCKTSYYFKQQALGPYAIQLQTFSSARATLCRESYLPRPRRYQHGLSNHRDFHDPPYSDSQSARMRSSSSSWAFPPAISKFRLPSFTPMPRAAFLAKTSRFSSRLAPGLLLSSLLIQASHRRRLDQSQHL